MQLDLLSILTPILSKLAKKWVRCHPQNYLDMGWGSRGAENYHFMLLFEFGPMFLMLKPTWIFLRSRNPFMRFWKNITFCFATKCCFTSKNLHWFYQHLFMTQIRRYTRKVISSWLKFFDCTIYAWLCVLAQLHRHVKVILGHENWLKKL